MGCLLAAAAKLLELMMALGMVVYAAVAALAERLLGEDHPITRRLRRAEDEYWRDLTTLL